jgi:hypothetical protein
MNYSLVFLASQIEIVAYYCPVQTVTHSLSFLTSQIEIVACYWPIQPMNHRLVFLARLTEIIHRYHIVPSLLSFLTSIGYTVHPEPVEG